MFRANKVLIILLAILPVFISCTKIRDTVRLQLIKHYVKKIKHGDVSEEACFASRKLGDIGDGRAIPFIIDILKLYTSDDDPDSISILLGASLLQLDGNISSRIISEYNEVPESVESLRLCYILVNIHDSLAFAFLYSTLKDRPYNVELLLKAIELSMDKNAEEYLLKLLDTLPDICSYTCHPSKAFFVMSKFSDTLAVNRMLSFLDKYKKCNWHRYRMEVDSCFRSDFYEQFLIRSNEAKLMLADLLSRNEHNKLAISILSNSKDTSVCDCLASALTRDSLTGLAALALAKIGCKKAIPDIYSYLTNWDVNRDIAGALYRLGWEPVSDADKIHMLVAHRNLSDLKNNEKAVTVLLNDITANSPSGRTNAFNALIAIGDTLMLPKLKKILLINNSMELALLFANSGNTVLRIAAFEWARRNGYTFQQLPGSPGTKWGSF